MNDGQNPEVAAAIREELIRRVELTPVSRWTRQGTPQSARPPRRHSRLSGLIATSVTLVVVVAASVTAITLSGRAPVTGPAASTPPASIEVDGKTVPSAGVVSWSDAVVDEADPRVITISASGSVLHRTTWFCTLAQWRSAAVETTTSVRIEVQGYAVPLDPDTYCNASAPQPHEVRVTLDSPLGDRTLIDAATTRTQPALDASTVPTIGLMPSVDTDTVGWDQESGTAIRTYVDPDRAFDGTVSLEYGTPEALAASGAVSRTPDVNDISIGASSASLWSFESNGGFTTRVEWTSADGHRLRLDVVQTTSGADFTRAEVVQLARSVR